MKTKRLNQLTSALAVTAALSASAAAQDLIPSAAPQAEPIVLRGATLHTVSGDVIEGGDLLFEGGVIRSVSKARVDAKGARVIDLEGKHVFPSFVLATSTVGLVEVSSVDMTIDTSEAGAINPEVYAAVAVNADSWHIPVTRRNGVLVAGVFPQGGLVPGGVSVIQLDGWTWEDLALETRAGMAINWPFMGSRSGRFARFGGGGGSAEETIARLDATFDAAEAYIAAKEADPTLATDMRYEAMRPIVAGETPVFLSITTREQAESAIPWAIERGLKPAVVGGRDAAHFLDLLKRHDVMVAVTKTHRMPHRRDLSYATTYELPKVLDDAGVRWCMTMSGRDSSNARNLPYEAAAAVAHGLDRAAALRSVTLSAAEFLGVDDRVGSLDVGKHATLFVADGDPLELTTKIEHAFVQGREIALVDKQTALYGKYREKYRQKGLVGADAGK
ncbi:MAG: amidohydrolase family protein [Planctomycetota bacterium]